MLVDWSHHGQTVPTSCCRGSTSKFWWNPVYSRIAVSPSRGGGTATVHISKPWAPLSKPSPMTSRLRPHWGPVQESHWGKVSWQWNFQLHTQVLLRLRVWQISSITREPKEHNIATAPCLAIFLGRWRTCVDFHLRKCDCVIILDKDAKLIS
jgi:hypothetical protein